MICDIHVHVFFQGGEFEILAFHNYALNSLPQAIGDGGQGWGNAILYIFNSPKIRNLLLKDLTSCYSRTANVLNDCRNRMKVKTKDYEVTTTSEYVRMSVQDESKVDFGSSGH